MKVWGNLEASSRGIDLLVDAAAGSISKTRFHFPSIFHLRDISKLLSAANSSVFRVLFQASDVDSRINPRRSIFVSARFSSR